MDHSRAPVLEALQEFRSRGSVDLPSPDELQLETAMLPRDAFFAEVEQVPADRAAGRISAEMITPYPPGAPAILPGEVITDEVLDYVRSGLAAGMQLPDPADPDLKSVRVVSARAQAAMHAP